MFTRSIEMLVVGCKKWREALKTLLKQWARAVELYVYDTYVNWEPSMFCGMRLASPGS